MTAIIDFQIIEKEYYDYYNELSHRLSDDFDSSSFVAEIFDGGDDWSLRILDSENEMKELYEDEIYLEENQDQLREILSNFPHTVTRV